MREKLIMFDLELAAGARPERAVGLLVDPLAERLVILLVVDDLRKRRRMRSGVSFSQLAD